MICIPTSYCEDISNRIEYCAANQIVSFTYNIDIPNRDSNEGSGHRKSSIYVDIHLSQEMSDSDDDYEYDPYPTYYTELINAAMTFNIKDEHIRMVGDVWYSESDSCMMHCTFCFKKARITRYMIHRVMACIKIQYPNSYELRYPSLPWDSMEDDRSFIHIFKKHSQYFRQCQRDGILRCSGGKYHADNDIPSVCE